MTDKTKEVLSNATVIDKQFIKLPEGQLNRKEYMDVKKTLEQMGGKWKGGKVQAFEFKIDPTDMLNEVVGGKKVNRKKDFQFFATPDEIADKIVGLSDLNNSHSILEPSAGQGAIIEAIHRKMGKSIDISYFELMPENRLELDSKCLGANYLGEDFLKIEKDLMFDRIIANPPFTRNSDIKHLTKMYEHLKVGGVLVCITSASWYYGNQKKQKDFATWLNSINAEIIDLPSEAFKSSGTKVETKIVKIIKQ